MKMIFNRKEKKNQTPRQQNAPDGTSRLRRWLHRILQNGLAFVHSLRKKDVTVPVCAKPQAAAPASGRMTQTGNEMRQIIDYLQDRYQFRYNTVMGYVEYRHGSSNQQDWKPLDERVVNGFTTDARLDGINVWDKDVNRFVKSDKIRLYNPVEDYLRQVRGKWDGTDHIGFLARTVPTDNPHWPSWFRTWLLAMVGQWMGRSRRYGNAVCPLLVSGQGYNKSTFCRSLLPEELQWGYTDSLSLGEKRSVLQAMSQMLLINLDEFNQISARTQDGFLKNIIQLPSVKIRRPYGKHVEDFPRMASFIATTNMCDVLTDPTGSRRFIGVELTAPIDVGVRPNHEQIYAQAQALLSQGEPCWFDDAQTRLIMKHNRRFQRKSPAELYFREIYEAAADTQQGRWLSTATIYRRLCSACGSAVRQTNIIAFGRMLSATEGLQRRRTTAGTEYLVRER